MSYSLDKYDIGPIFGAFLIALGSVLLPVEFRLLYTGKLTSLAITTAYAQSWQYGYGFLIMGAGVLVFIVSQVISNHGRKNEETGDLKNPEA